MQTNIFGRAFKAATAVMMRWAGLRWSGGWGGLVAALGRTDYDYAAQIGESGLGNAAVVACVRWICRTFPEATLQVLQAQADGTEIAVPNAPLAKLLRRPNGYYSGELLWRATLADWTTNGNAYWLKVRSRYREPVELWWLPQQLIEPVWPQDGSAYLSHYEYKPNGETIIYDPADVVHFRDGMDPQNTRKGLSPLASLLREIFTDDEAANFTASLLRNMGVPGVIIAPDTDEVNVSPDDAKAIKAQFKQLTSADNRGEPLVLPARVRVTPLNFTPAQLDLKALRRIPEERISAVLGVPAIVAGLGAGLDRSTFSNMAEAREAAYESNIIPNQRLFAADLGSQLLTEWDATGAQRVAWDYRQVRVLQEDQNALWKRVDTAVRGGWLMVSRAKEIVGERAEPGDEVYLRGGTGGTEGTEGTDEERTDTDGARTGKSLLAVEVETKARGRGYQRRVLAALERDRVRLTAKMAGELDEAFEQLADDMMISVNGVAKQAGGTWSIRLTEGELVQVELPEEIDSTFQTLYRAAFKVILETTLATIEDALEMPVGVNLADPVAREMIRGWATRKGLADITEQTRTAIMDALADGRAAGDGAEALARRIRGYVEGRDMYPGVYQEAFDRAKKRGWGDAAAEKAGDRAARQYRSETIARTETKIAQNRSSIFSYRNNPLVKALRVFDGDDCGWMSHDDGEKADGKVVTFDEADAYPLAHPRCVRSFAPVVED